MIIFLLYCDDKYIYPTKIDITTICLKKYLLTLTTTKAHFTAFINT